ncbi:PAS domain S-box protein [Sediminispirochaeta smaragdinae]|uniref:histidine kinase n=1 Tax=Sediminispirochaeta smaragdinae (strain DSM 11293 / JCM 15392 / SEBR 4228) TaxID=573413 RepID=E1R2D3_SEDSS|nr:PAS domain S-box protein [Sediminispirochaeta smaragdinae]ADK82493.1 putative signal transduction histidine kinase [Sediminispirochaeta smaragdinae DSM 11293]
MKERKKRLLLVEDEAITALAETRFLESIGYEVLHVFSGEAALEAVTPEIDLILMDIDLGPGISGTETASRILKKRELPILFLSSHSSQEMVEKVRNITRYGYVVKNSGYFVLQASIEMAFTLFEACEQQRQTLRYFRRAEEVSAMGHWRMSRDSEHFLFSEGAVAICGLPAPLFSVAKFRLLVLPEDRILREQALERAIRDKTTYKAEYRIARPDDGRVIWIRSIADVEASDEIVFGVLRDITDLKKLENPTLVQPYGVSEKNHYYNLFDESSLPMFMLDPEDGSIVDANRAASEFYGWPMAILCQMKMADINILPFASAKAEMRSAVKLRKNFFFFCHRKADGSTCEVVVITNPVRIEGRSYLHSIIMDLYSPQSEELEKARRYWYLAEFSGAVVWTIDLEHETLSYISPSVEKVFGFTVESAKKLGIRGLLTPDSYDALMADSKREGPQIGLYQHYRSDGSIADIEITAIAVTGKACRCCEIVGVSRDISARLAAEREIEKLNDTNKQLFQEVQYRIRYTLLVIADLLKIEEQALTVETAYEALEDARKRVSSLSVFYDKLFTFPDYRVVPVRPYIEELLRYFSSQSKKRHIEIEGYVEDLTMNIQQLFLVSILIQELVNSAGKHAFHNMETGHISVTIIKLASSSLEVVVSDDGVDTDEETHYPSAIGLGIITEVANMLSATVESRTSSGTTYKIRIPLSSL